jgi:autotransporter translocation and assembly factor TamB
LSVAADHFTFQEWAHVVPGLERLPVDSKFTAHLKGPLAKLAMDLDFHSNGGDAKGSVLLDTTVPGWHGTGSLQLTHLNLETWFNDPAQKSDISGKADFDLALQLGQGVPRGSYTFAGSHAEYGGYQGDRIRITGNITEREWRIARGAAVAYGANISLTAGAIGLPTPHTFAFRGTAQGVDLRTVPQTIPVPHVESLLTFDFDVTGQFTQPFIAGHALFADSMFVGARVAPGTTGSIDTSLSPVGYTGEGDITGIDLQRLGAAFDVAWMQDPDYAGTVAGHFRAEGEGFEPSTMTLDASGRLSDGKFFNGRLHDADVEIHIRGGSLAASYDGGFNSVNPAIAFGDERLEASLTGQGKMRMSVPQFFLGTVPLSAYTIDGEAALEDSDARGIHLDRGNVAGALRDNRLALSTVRGSGPQFDLQGSGTIALDEAEPSEFDYEIGRADLALLGDAFNGVSGTLVTAGRLTGPGAALHVVGDAGLDHVSASGVTAVATTGHYDVTFPWDSPADAVGRVAAQVSSIEALGQQLRQATGSAAYDHRRLTLNVAMDREDGLSGTLVGTAMIHPGERAIDLEALSVSVGSLNWRMLPAQPAPILSWDDTGVMLTALTLVDVRDAAQRVDLSGSWRPSGGGALQAKATGLSLDRLTAEPDRPATYGGVVQFDATLRGTSDEPIVESQVSITDGRIRRMSYEKLAGTVAYRGGMLEVALQLDQAPGIWMTAVGTIPPTLLSTDAPDRPVDMTLVSSDVDLSLLEGITSLVRDVTGQVRGNLQIGGTTLAPTLIGKVDVSGASFLVDYTGARYHNGSASLELSGDRISVAAFHLEDRSGRPLEVHGSLGAKELRVGDVEVDITARRFEVLRNATGNAQVDANLKIRGTYDAPRLFGDVTIVGGELKVDELMSRTLFEVYSTTGMEAEVTQADALSGLNPWDRLSLDINLHSQSALRMTGENLSVAQDAPLGLGSFNLRATGDIFLYKQPDEVMSVTGSLDSISGSYAFQGRRFELYPSSAVDFHGDLNPSLYISVSRVISGVEVRVTISGTLQEPELRLSSTPPLDPSDILALIVFNSPANALSANQTTDLASRAGTLALGFMTNTLTSALERSIGLDLLEVEPLTSASGTTSSAGAKVTVGEEIAPGLIARFSRQFGTDQQFDEATIEYFISRILHIRATYSDAAGLAAASPFRRVERTGIDLLLLFSF